MNIDDVLLTNNEIATSVKTMPDICDTQLLLANTPLLAGWIVDLIEKNNKAQCLKLLEWLGGRCMRHIKFGQADGFYPLRKDCSYCVAELESKLKEG